MPCDARRAQTRRCMHASSPQNPARVVQRMNSAVCTACRTQAMTSCVHTTMRVASIVRRTKHCRLPNISLDRSSSRRRPYRALCFYQFCYCRCGVQSALSFWCHGIACAGEGGHVRNVLQPADQVSGSCRASVMLYISLSVRLHAGSWLGNWSSAKSGAQCCMPKVDASSGDLPVMSASGR